MKKDNVIVVGAGVSGLLSALALSKEGKNVVILEKEKYIGGNCRTYNVGDYKVDTGPHIITGLYNGPLANLMRKYFTFKPEFVNHETYHIRTEQGLKTLPWSLKNWIISGIISKKDGVILTQAIATATIQKALKGDINTSVEEYLQSFSLSDDALKLTDAICYFLTGVSMKKTPVWRVLDGGCFTNWEPGIRSKIHKAIQITTDSRGPIDHGYPRGGIGSIIKSIEYSLPKNVVIKTDEEVYKIEDNKTKKIYTNKGEYKTEIIVYSGYCKDLPNIITLPKKYVKKLSKIEQAKSLTVWVGLKKKMKDFNYLGSEVWFNEKQYWAVPVSNYDASMAPHGKQLIGFGFVTKNPKKDKKKALETIYNITPKIKKNIDMTHIQINTPEKAAITVDTELPSPKSPIKGLYLVGTDTDYRSMGITKASYSVIEMLKYMKKDKII